MSLRQKKLAGVILFAALTLLLVWRLRSSYSPEPVYDGKSLSTWAGQYGSNHWGRGNSVAGDEAQFAIRQIGTNAIPFFLDRIRVRNSALKQILSALIPRSWHGSLHLQDTSEDIRQTGAYGLAALGTNAAAALPMLIEIATHHPDEEGRYIAVFTIRTLDAAAEPAIPFLIQCLTNTYFNIRADAAWGLGYMERQPEVVVPALVRYLGFARTSPHMTERLAAMDSLAHFGTKAKPAAPLISPLLTNPVQLIRIYATNALSRIEAEPEAKLN